MKRNFLLATVGILAALSAVAIAFSFLSAHLPLADSVSHFRFHLTVALFTSGVALFLLKRWLWGLAVFATALVGVAGLSPALQIRDLLNPHTPPLSSFRVLQINVGYTNRELQRIVDLVHHERPDIVTLQELAKGSQHLTRALAATYPYQIRCRAFQIVDVAILSRWPETSTPSRGCMRGEALAWFRISIQGKPVSIATLHLRWPYPYGQWKHLDRIEPTLKAIPRPMFVSGDFNAAPWSASVGRIARMTSTNVVAGLRFTTIRSLTPWGPLLHLPIDHILRPHNAQVVRVRLGPNVGSDHLPVIADFLLHGHWPFGDPIGG